MLTWFRENFGTLLLSLILAVMVWFIAVNEDDPRVEHPLSNPVDIQFTGVPDGFLITNPSATQASVTLLTTQSIWNELSDADIRVVADMSGLEQGTYKVPLQAKLTRRLVKVTEIAPESVIVTLEVKETKTLPVQVVTLGSPALSYTAEDPVAEPRNATIVGPASAVARVVELRAALNLTNRQESLDQLVTLNAMDENGLEVNGIQISPETVRVQIQITQQPNYRLVSVIPKIEGQDELVEAGYLVTEVTVTPQWVTIFSSDPQAFEDLPGYIETVPLDLSGAVDDVEQQLQLDLPPGFSLAFEQSVTVKVDIEPRTNSITINRPLDVRGVGTDLYALLSPDEVSIILTGPAALLNTLQPEEIIVVVDVTGLEPGTYQITPQIIGIPEIIDASGPIPATIQVTISATPLPTPTSES
ncbi:MAG: CdaR family protein [Anaerolineales bacterium]|jgi:YbbR domain-containing protein